MVDTGNAVRYEFRRVSTKVKVRRRGGRKPLGKVRVQLKLTPATNELIERRSIEAGITKSEFVDRLVLGTVGN
jgi:hypothetical protein